MKHILNRIVGDLDEKRKYKETTKRAKALPDEYATAYTEIRNYLWNTSGILTIAPLTSLVDLLEEAAANGKKVTDVTGPDVAAFADEFVRDEKSYKDTLRKKLNKKLNSQGVSSARRN